MSYTFTGYKLPKVLGAYKKSVKMHNMTWTGVGGVAPLLFKPQDAEDLAEFLRCTSFSVKAIGAGSNVVIRDGVVDKVIIKLGREFADMSCDGNTITIGCAASLTELVAFARENAISGFEFCVGIPGTVGGAIATNVSAYGSDIASVLHTVRAVNEYGEICTLSKYDMEYSYRKHGLCGEWVFVDATFKGHPGELSAIKSFMSELVLRRNASQPIYTGKVIGYVFKNPQGEKEARALIEEVGCKGLQRGNAVVSEKHCNFIENIGGATASDIEDLGHEVRHRVGEKLGIDLEWNIEFLGVRVVK